MSFGTAVLIVLGAWSLLSIAVSVTIGRVAGFRDEDTAAVPRLRAFEPRDREREQIAS